MAVYVNGCGTLQQNLAFLTNRLRENPSYARTLFTWKRLPGRGRSRHSVTVDDIALSIK